MNKESYLDSATILKTISNLSKDTQEPFVHQFSQSQLGSGKKWIDVLFGTDKILDDVKNAAPSTLNDYFKITRGNSVWGFWALEHGSRPDIGTKQFFYLSEDDVKERDFTSKYIHRALTSARYSRNFIYGIEDWEKTNKSGAASYFFMCHISRNSLPNNVLNYLKWGETECRTTIRGTRGGGAICSQAYTCRQRERWKNVFRGWYDLGGVVDTPIMAIYQSQYQTRFFLCKTPVVTYHAIVTFSQRPEANLSEIELKALLAILNSAFTNLYVESRGRATALGLIALEITQAKEIPIPDIKKLTKSAVNGLAESFDALEAKSRTIGGADTRKNLIKIRPELEEIDTRVARVLGLEERVARECRRLTLMLMERRIARVEEAAPNILGSFRSSGNDGSTKKINKEKGDGLFRSSR